MQSQTLKIEHARYVVTLDGARRIIQDGAILVEAARVSGPARRPSWPGCGPTA